MLYLTTKRVFENLGGLLPGCPLYLRAWCLCERRYSDRTNQFFHCTNWTALYINVHEILTKSGLAERVEHLGHVDLLQLS